MGRRGHLLRGATTQPVATSTSRCGSASSLTDADGEHSSISTIRYGHRVSALLDAGAVLKEARRRVGMTQVDLARTAGVTQSVVSAYESGARQPSLVTLQRLVSAAGFELVISLSPQAARRDRLTGPLGRRVLRERRRLTEVAARHGASNVRVFGSVARGAEGPDSDVDLLADLAPGTGLLGLGRLEHDLADVLHARVDVVPATDLKPGVAESVLSEAIPL